MKTAGVIVVLAIGGVAYYHYVYAPQRSMATGEVEYVLPESLPVVDTTAEVRRVIATLHSGQQVRVTASFADWAGLRLAERQTGWVPAKDLLDAQTYDEDQELLKSEQESPVQSAGHINTVANVHLKPSRGALAVGRILPGQRVDVYDRRLVERDTSAAGGSGKPIRDVWYLVRSVSTGGWVLGDFVDLDVPQGLAPYAQGINMVAWMPLDTVDDAGRQVPQYLAADRIGRRDVDFNHIRVFTWWLKRHEYVTAYVESNLDGYFPITVSHTGQIPHFRLRLVDPDGHRYQKVYGLFDTIVRPLGIIDGWKSSAMPAPVRTRSRRRSGEARRRGFRAHSRLSSIRGQAGFMSAQ